LDNLEQSDINSTRTEYFEGRQICVNCCILAELTVKKTTFSGFTVFSSFFFLRSKLLKRDNSHLMERINNAHTSLAN